jgi:hypothetical protein
MTTRIGVGLVIGALVLCPGIVSAKEHGGKEHAGQPMTQKLHTLSLTKDYTASPWTTEVGYGNRAKAKLGFGLKNLLLGWADLFTETKEAMDSGGNFFVGLGHGVKDAIENELGGAVHLVTFPVTCLDAPLPEGGTQLL